MSNEEVRKIDSAGDVEARGIINGIATAHKYNESRIVGMYVAKTINLSQSEMWPSNKSILFVLGKLLSQL